jgi:hypothetical protein
MSLIILNIKGIILIKVVGLNNVYILLLVYILKLSVLVRIDTYKSGLSKPFPLKKEHRPNVFENRALWKISGPKRYEKRGGRKQLHNEKLHNLYSSLYITRTIKSRRMIWTGHVIRTGRRRMHIGFWWESQNERDHKKTYMLDGRLT